MKRRALFVLTSLLVVALFHCDVCAQSKIANPAKEDPKLPNVLLLGDSISIGYTPSVRERLQGQANVYRPPVNCQHTAYGLENLKTWLGDRKWDVIHFNWGIWDTHYLHDGKLVRTTSERDYPPNEIAIRHTQQQYIKNLEKILIVLQATDAKLIWASTTPVMSREGKRFEDIPSFNKAAAELMRQRGVEVNDLYCFVLPHALDWQNTDRVHYNELGNRKLAERVTRCIERALQSKTQADLHSPLPGLHQPSPQRPNSAAPCAITPE